MTVSEFHVTTAKTHINNMSYAVEFSQKELKADEISLVPSKLELSKTTYSIAVEDGFSFNLERMKAKVENEIVEMPKGISNFEEFDAWMRG